MKKGKKPTKGKPWKPDRQLPKNTFDPITGKGDATGLFGTALLGYWQWIDDDTISWALTSNSAKKASQIGAELGGYLEVTSNRIDSDINYNPIYYPQRLSMFRSAYKDCQQIEAEGSSSQVTESCEWEPVQESILMEYHTRDIIYSSVPILFGETKRAGPYKLVYEYGAPIGKNDTRFMLLDNGNTQIASGLI